MHNSICYMVKKGSEIGYMRNDKNSGHSGDGEELIWRTFIFWLSFFDNYVAPAALKLFGWLVAPVAISRNSFKAIGIYFINMNATLYHSNWNIFLKGELKGLAKL